MLALGGAAYVALRTTDSGTEQQAGVETLRPLDEMDVVLDERTVPPALVGRHPEGAVPAARVEGWITALSGRPSKACYAALWEIVRSGTRDLRLREPLERIIDETTGARCTTAMLALMRLEHSRRYMVAMAEQTPAGRTPRGLQGWFTILDPELGNAFFRAFSAARYARLREAPYEALQGVADLLVSDRMRGRALLLRHLVEAAAGDQLTWLHVACGIRPLPAEVGAILIHHLEGGFDKGPDPLESLLRDRALDYSEIGPEVAAALLARLPEAKGVERDRIFVALGNMQCGGREVLDALIAGLAVPQRRKQTILSAFEQLGAAAAPAAADLIEACRELNDSHRKELAQALLAMGSVDALPYLADRLRGGTSGEQALIASALHDFPQAGTLAPVLAGVARRQGNPHALRALVLMDPKLEGHEAREALREALGSSVTVLRKEALELIPRTTWLPDDVVDAVLRRAGEWKDEVRPAAYAAIAELGRLSVRGRAWIAELIALTRRDEIGLACAALRALGEIDGNDPRVRRLLFETIEEHDNLRRPELVSEDDYQILRAALWGLGGTDHPTPEQYRRIARMGGRYTSRKRYLLGERMRVLGNPTWERVRAEVGIKLSHRPRIRPPPWGRDEE